MLFYLTSRIVSATAAFLYPGYASYKTLSQRPASEEDLERWLMYWSVLGCVVSVEYMAEWVVSWIPFYFTLKTLFLLYLALPQTKGSTYIYLTHLQPFFRKHENRIDSTLASFKARAYAIVQERLRLLWDQVAVAMGQQAQAQQQGDAEPASAPTNASAPAQLLGSLWTSYGPSILASGAALLRQGATAASNRIPTGTGASMGSAAQRPHQPLSTPSGSFIRSDSSQSVLEERKRQLQAELAALDAQTAAAGITSVPMPSASPQLLPSRGSSDSDLRSRERTTSGRFEEIEVPSDDESAGYESGRQPGAGQRKPSGWFGGWTGGTKDGYERVKSD
ncbi:hypothetical protein FA15DRAFT_639433 [Coprinopsis marcescibilis]|uniref:Protein YOP1 n=1 Tax=Coprinopsis marcescibilis TaxID=230819 RepID=A0A5C3KYP5_COPMA|nr:hypothetical protein FA15DRAFT_639433 [Coprinopsis marcescibilis]